MSAAVDDLPVALPPGCAGARINVLTVAAMAGDDPSASRRADFLAGRLAAAEAMRRLGIEAGGVLGRTSEGAPAWPVGVAGSISHHSGVACAVVSEVAAGVGVDITPLLAESQLRAVVRRCLIDPARERWQSPHEVAVVFAATESIYKAAQPPVGRHPRAGARRVDGPPGGAPRRRTRGRLGVGLVRLGVGPRLHRPRSRGVMLRPR